MGMERQAKYDQGIQKIQGQIDNVAGMDVLKDVDKANLQSKLNQLGSDLKKVAASDFSNFQLVNSVGGMATQIIKDPTIQAAVSSTANYRKQAAEMEAARKAGKSSPSNEFIFNSKFKSYMDNPEVGQPFDTKYEQFTNWKKNSLEVIKALTKNKNISDDAFAPKINQSTGQVELDASGNPILEITDAIVRKELAGISPEQIQQALTSALSPADFRQMEIDGLYNYANKTPDQFKQIINNTYTDRSTFYENQIKALTDAKSSTKSNLEKEKLDAQINSLSKVLKNSNKEFNGILDLIDDGDVDGAKATFGTINSIGGMARAFSFTEVSQTYENNPLAERAFAREEAQRKIYEFKATYDQRNAEHRDTMRWKQKEFDQAQEAIDAKKKEEAGYGGLPGAVDQSLLPKYKLGKLLDDVVVGTKRLEDNDATFLQQQGKDQAWLNSKYDAWEKNPNSVAPEVAAHFNSTVAEKRKIQGTNEMIAEITAKADAKFGDIKSLIPKDSPNIEYTTPSGTKYIYSPMDMVSYSQVRGKYITVGPSSGPGGGAGVPVFDDAAAKQELSPKAYHLYEIDKQRVDPRFKQSGLTKADGILWNQVDYLRKNVLDKNKEHFKRYDDFTANEVNNRLTNYQGVSYPIPTATTAQKTSIGTMLSGFANLAEKQNGKLPGSPNFDVSKARKIAQDPNSKYNITVVEGTEYQPSMYEVTGTGADATVQFKVTPEQKRAVFGNDFEASKEIAALKPYQEQIRKAGGYSTSSKSGETTPENSYLNKVDFPSVSVYGTKGNLINSSGEYGLKLVFFDPIKKVWSNEISFPRNNLMIDKQVVPAMYGLNDAAIFELLNNRPMTAKDLKQLQEAAKKPF